MIETITIITVSVLLLIFFRPGKTPPLNNPLVIERPGKYRIILAPKLNLAQPFIEAIAKRIESTVDTSRQCATAKFFVIQDKQITTHGSNDYLLAIVYRNGMQYFEAEWPLSNNHSNHLDTIRAFARDILANIPDKDEHSKKLEESIIFAINEVAEERGVIVKPITE